MLPAALALALAATPAVGARLPAAPLQVFTIAWQRALVPAALDDWRPIEPGGPAVDAASGTVVVGTRDGWLHAFRPDGSLRWELQGEGAFGAPPAIEGGTVYAGTGGGVLYAVDLATGKARWRYDAKEEMGTRPAVAGGLVIFATLEDTVAAVDVQSGAWRWQHRRERGEGMAIRGAADVVVRGGTVFAAYSDGTVAALELATGSPRWEEQVAPAGRYRDVDSLALGGGRLFAAAYSGAVVALGADDGKVRWQVSAPDADRLALLGDTLVVVTTTAIEALSPETGAPLWKTPLVGGGPTRDPVLAGPWIAVATGKGGLQFLEPSTGRIARTLDGGQGVNASPAVAGGRVYVLANGGTLYALDLR